MDRWHAAMMFSQTIENIFKWDQKIYLVAVFDFPLENDQYNEEDFFRVEMLYRDLLIYHADISFNSNGTRRSLRTLEYVFDTNTGKLKKVNFYRGDFRTQGYDWKDAIFWPNVKSIVEEANRKAHKSAKKLHTHLGNMIKPANDLDTKSELRKLSVSLEKIITSS